jgi:hypothetical protein
MRIRLIWEGKTKNAQLRALQDDYSARIRHFTPLMIEEVPPSGSTGRSRPGAGKDRISSAERHLLDKVDGSYRVLLDPAG